MKATDDDWMPRNQRGPNKINEEALNRCKFHLCHQIDRLITRERWTQKQAAYYLGTSQANVSRVGNKKLDQLSMTQLFNYLCKLSGNFRLLISI